MTYVIRSSGKKEEFDGDKLIASIMEAANNAGIMNQMGIEDLIKSISSDTISYARTQKEVQSKTLSDVILAQILKIGIQMAMQKFGANVSKENILHELINAGLQISNQNTQSNDLLSQLLSASTAKSSSQSNDLLSQLLSASTDKSSSQSNDLLSQLLSASTRKNSSNQDLGEMLIAGMKLANALMK